MKTVLKTENITKIYNNGEMVLRDITFEIKAGSFTAMLGQSGSGKSTLLNVISGLLKPTAGEVWFGGKRITGLSEEDLADWRRSSVGTTFQNYLLLNNLTVRENIEIGISAASSPLPFEELVRILEIDSLLGKFPAQLSGGQQQRTAIARAAIKKPDILFCDEATGALDEAGSKKVVQLLHSLKSTYGIAVLFVTHNLQIAETADRIITIKDGRLFHDKINENPISAGDMDWSSL